MRKLLLSLPLLSLLSFNGISQVFYTETFDGAACAATSGCDPSLVSWTTTITGAEGSTPNRFYVSCQENGNAAGACGSGCGTDQSLHVGNVAGSPAGAFFCPSGDCGAAYDASPGCEANRRAESPVIDCSAAAGISISFVYMEQGEGTNDDAQLWYNDGVTWTMINTLAKTPLGGCAPQGQWTAFTTTLPASADGNPNVRIGFSWVNNGNNVGTDPSFAVDDITLTSTSVAGPVAGFTFSPASPCVGDVVTFTNTSTGSAPLTFGWSFAGGTPATSTATNPTTTFSTPGPHTVILIVQDGGGNLDTISQVVTVNACTSPVAGFTFSPASPCTGQTVNFTNTTTGTAPFTYSWTFPSGSPATSTATNPSVSWAAPGTYTITLIASDGGGGSPDTVTQTITVVTCTGPIANFTFSPSPICAGSPVTFTNTTTGGSFVASNWTFVGAVPNSGTGLVTQTTTWATPGTYTVQLIATTTTGTDTMTTTVTVINCATPPVANFTFTNPICITQCIPITNTSTSSAGTFTSQWTFAGGTPASSTSNNPGTICFNTLGTFNITLIVTDANGSDTLTQAITVNNCTVAPTADFTAPDTICRGQCINFTDLSGGTPTSWTWSFGGGTPASSTVQNPASICFNSPGTFMVTLVASNSMGSSSVNKPIVVINCSPPLTSFVTNGTVICVGDCITVDNTTFNGTTYSWSFPGAVPSSSTAAEPGEVCYTSSGTFDITLIATNAFGSDTMTQMVIVDTVPIIEAFPDEVSVSLGGSLDMYAVANGSVDWNWVTIDTNSLDTTTLSAVVATPSAPGTIVYYVYATGANGCSNVDSVIVVVELTDVIGVPNAFSPNGDGFNDFLNVLGPGISKMKIVIYNRYGQQVFESSDQAKGWDGTHNSKDVDPGVFGFYLEYTLENGTTGFQKGNITLIR